MNDTEYQNKRKEVITLGAAALLVADIISKGMPQPGVAVHESVGTAFHIAETFLTEAEKRLGGKIPF